MIANWLGAHGAIVAFLVVARFGLLLAGTVLVISTALALVLHLFGWAQAARWAALLSLPPIRNSLLAATGLSLGASGVSFLRPPSAPLFHHHVPPFHHSIPSKAPKLAPSHAMPVPRARTTTEAAQAPAPPQTWEVRPGEDFWAIASSVLEERLGRPAGNGAIAQYCNRLIAANRDRLVSPGSPSLIYPGQIFVLPLPQPKEVS